LDSLSIAIVDPNTVSCPMSMKFKDNLVMGSDDKGCIAIFSEPLLLVFWKDANRWLTVQDWRFHYLVDYRNGIEVRMVLSEYLAWSDSMALKRDLSIFSATFLLIVSAQYCIMMQNTAE
jgi:hypothetical protein